MGRFGQKLATAIALSGVEVIAIDRDIETVDMIAGQVSHAVRLDSTGEDALRAQGIDKVAVGVVSIGPGTGQGFESAALTVVNLRQMGVPLICARVP